VDLERLKQLRAIGVHEYEEDPHGFRVSFYDHPVAPDEKKKPEPASGSPHRMALVALKGIPNLNPDATDPRGANETPAA
jgi:hypothetical protein